MVFWKFLEELIAHDDTFFIDSVQILWHNMRNLKQTKRMCEIDNLELRKFYLLNPGLVCLLRIGV